MTADRKSKIATAAARVRKNLAKKAAADKRREAERETEQERFERIMDTDAAWDRQGR